jgi:hypothetical protein
MSGLHVFASSFGLSWKIFIFFEEVAHWNGLKKYDKIIVRIVLSFCRGKEAPAWPRIISVLFILFIDSRKVWGYRPISYYYQVKSMESSVAQPRSKEPT